VAHTRFSHLAASANSRPLHEKVSAKLPQRNVADDSSNISLQWQQLHQQQQQH